MVPKVRETSWSFWGSHCDILHFVSRFLEIGEDFGEKKRVALISEVKVSGLPS